jgi:NAD(P)-dependent dehydrogenase (short-subunit alcohol dehydrogenase family)
MASLDFGLTDVHVLVTGASGGIGLELTRTFLSLGSKVTAHYNTSKGELPDLPQANLHLAQANVTSETDVARLFASAQSHHGVPVQALVVNHGIFPVEHQPILGMTLSQWRNTQAVNLDAAFLLCREFLKQLQNQPSPILEPVSITFIGSTAGKFGEAGHADYASSKAAVMHGLVPTLKNEIVTVAPRGRVNCVSPGWVETAMARELVKDEKVMARALATTPLRKIARPVDVAGQVAVLVSPALSGHVSGVNVMVDGGMEGRVLNMPPA